MRSRVEPARPSSILVATALVLLAAGCASPADEQPFDVWAEQMRVELTTVPSSPSAGGADGATVQLDVGEPGERSVGVACRGADAVTLELSSGGVVVTEIDVTCGETTVADVALPAGDALIVPSADVDWYAVYNG